MFLGSKRQNQNKRKIKFFAGGLAGGKGAGRKSGEKNKANR